MRGFTLAETVVVIAIVAVVGLAVTSMIAFFYKSNAYVFQQTSALDSAHRGVEYSFLNIREASYGDDGSYPVAQAATSSITFYADVDNDGPIERIRVYLAGGTLYRGVTNSAGSPPTYSGQTEAISTIATNVVNAPAVPIFRYFNKDGTELTTPINVSDIASVATELSVDLNPSRAPDIFTLRASATLRNHR
jgi:prepilin-type N-terminal cleavage/methylation domain-containing protein